MGGVLVLDAQRYAYPAGGTNGKEISRKLHRTRPRPELLLLPYENHPHPDTRRHPVPDRRTGFRPVLHLHQDGLPDGPQARQSPQRRHHLPHVRPAGDHRLPGVQMVAEQRAGLRVESLTAGPSRHPGLTLFRTGRRVRSFCRPIDSVFGSGTYYENLAMTSILLTKQAIFCNNETHYSRQRQ